jgi:hypothetical protein
MGKARRSKVALGYSTEGGIFTGAVYIAVEAYPRQGCLRAALDAGSRRMVRQDIDTPGLVLLKVRATRIKVWERNSTASSLS